MRKKEVDSDVDDLGQWRGAREASSECVYKIGNTKTLQS